MQHNITLFAMLSSATLIRCRFFILKSLYVLSAVLALLLGLIGCSKSSDIVVDLSVEPSSVARGESPLITLISERLLDKGTPKVTVEPQDGIALTNVQKTSNTKVTFRMVVKNGAPIGKRIVSLEVGNTVGECDLFITEAILPNDTDSGPAEETEPDTATNTPVASDSDTVLPQPKVELRPNTIFAGKTKDLSLFGINTHFGDSTMVTFPQGSGLVVTNTGYMGMTMTDGEQLLITVQADANATVGNIIGTVETRVGSQMETAYFVIEVVAAPSLTVSPSSGHVGDSVSVVLRGSGTHFQGDAPATLLLISPASSGVSINLDAITSETDMAATLYVTENATPGEYIIEATTSLDNTAEYSGDETVTATFTVFDDTVDTAVEPPDTDTLTESECNDFTIEPSIFSVGSFNQFLFFKAPTNITWISYDRSIEMVGENAHVYLSNLDDTPEEKCYVSTTQSISCSLNVGLMTTPGDYEVYVTSNGVTSCGKITVLEDDIDQIEIPTDYLPTFNMYPGTLNSMTNISDFYAFSAPAGTTAIFHAYSLDRTTMDPVLRLIDATGDEWITFDDNETSLGIDARMIYHFAEDGDYYMAVEPKLSDGDGDYQLYVYLLTHGNVTFETESGNDDFETAQTIDEPMSAVVHATMETTDDVDFYYFETTGPSTIQVVARRLNLIEDGFANTRITLYDDAQVELDVGSSWFEIPSTADPRIFVADAGSYYLKVEAEEATSGFYAVNIRPYIVINELNNTAGTNVPWVELQGYYNLDLAGYELCTFNGDGDPVDSSVPCVDLSGFVTDSDGYLAIHGDDFASDTLMLPEGPGAVSLLYQGTVMDKVQYGAVGSNSLAEGDPADVGTYRSIGRGSGVDSNDNQLDFIYMAYPSPGMPNDRTYQSAIPLYGEPAD